jgi:MFS family permease
LNVFMSFNPVVRRNLLVLFTAGLLFWSGLSALLPTLPLYIQGAGASDHMVGVVMGTFAVGLIASRGWLSRLADQRGRKVVMLIGMVAVAVAPLGYIFTTHIPLLMAIRAFHGISIAAFALAYSALVVDLSPPAHRGEIIGFMSLVNPVGMAVGPTIGGYAQAWFGFTPMFLIATGLGTLGLFCTAQVKEARQPQAVAQQSQHNYFWRLLLSPRIRIPAIVLLLVGLTFGCLSTFIPLFIQDVGANLNVGLFYTAVAIASFSIRLLVGRASDRYGRGIFISISLIFYALSMALLWRAHTASTFLLAGVINGAGAGTLVPMIAALMADRSHADERGRTFGVCMLGFDAGIALAGPVLGLFVEQIGYRGIFGTCAVLAILGLGVFLAFSGKDTSHSLRFALGVGRDSYAIDLPQVFPQMEAQLETKQSH